MPRYFYANYFLLYSEWGFDKKGEKNIGGRCISYTFSSPLFLRDQPELCSMMIRMAKKDWKASRAPRRKSAQSQPAPSQSNSEPEQPEPEKPDQPEQQYDIPQAQPLLSHIHLPVMMSFVPVPVWPTQAQAINLLGRSHRPVPSQRPFPQMTHQLAPTQLNYASRQVALARDIIDRQLLETARLHVPPMMHQLATTQPKFASGHVPLARDIINKPLETASRRIPPMMHQFAPNQPNYDNGHLPLARDIIDSKPLEKSGSFNKPQPRKEMVTIRKQNTKASLLKSELNAAIAMSMLDGKDRE